MQTIATILVVPLVLLCPLALFWQIGKEKRRTLRILYFLTGIYNLLFTSLILYLMFSRHLNYK